MSILNPITLPCIATRDEARYQRRLEEEECRERAAEERLEDWRRDGEVAAHLFEALIEHPSGEQLADKIVFGCADTRNAAGGALYGILYAHAQRLADRAHRTREAGRLDALIDAPF